MAKRNAGKHSIRRTKKLVSRHGGRASALKGVRSSSSKARMRARKVSANPLPANWTAGKVRVNNKGQVQVMLTGKAAQKVARKLTAKRRRK